HLVCSFTFLLAAVASASGAMEPSPTLTAKELGQGFRDRRIVAKPRAALRESGAQTQTRDGVRIRRSFRHIRGLQVLDLETDESVPQAIARLRATGRYEYVEPDHVLYSRIAPNDPHFSQQWALRNNGNN